jgi:carbonic anhydrase
MGVFSYPVDEAEGENSMTDNRVHLIDFAAYLKDLGSDAEKEADLLLLTCMDFRFFLKVAELMKGIKYDHVTLAGAALGAVVPKKVHWHEMFIDHVKLAIDLHKIKRIIVMEHRDCGAYGPRGFRLLPEKPTPEEERQVHDVQVAELDKKIRRYGLGFGALLLEVPKGTDALTFDQLI